MMKFPLKNTLWSRLEVLLGWFLGAIFLIACWEKLLDPASFANVIYAYQILPDYLINAAAVFLPWLELLAALCLMSGIWRPGAAGICAGLMIVFISATLFNLSRGLNISCGCFSNSTELVTSGTVVMTMVRDIFFLLLALVLVWMLLVKQREKSPQG